MTRTEIVRAQSIEREFVFLEALAWLANSKFSFQRLVTNPCGLGTQA